MKTLFLLIISCSLTIACKKVCSVGEECTSNELSWLPYQDGQLLIFKNDSSEIDTFSVVKNAYYIDATSSNYDCSRFQVVDETIFVNGDFIKIEVMHWAGIPKVRAEANLQTNGARNFISDSPDTNNIVIDSMQYSNLRLLFPSNNGNSTFRIHNVYYSKLKGIVSFQSPDGNRWHLLN